MNGVPMNSQLLALLSQGANQQTPNTGAAVMPPYMLKMLSGQAGTGLGSDQQLAAAQDPRTLMQMGM